MTFYNPSPSAVPGSGGSSRWPRSGVRQIQFSAVQDGYEYIGVVAKTGKRQIIIALFDPSLPSFPSASKIYKLGFTA